MTDAGADAKIVICVDRRTRPARVYTVYVGPEAPWFDLLPDLQVANIDAKAPVAFALEQRLPDPIVVAP
jgi:hypothetical protein